LFTKTRTKKFYSASTRLVWFGFWSSSICNRVVLSHEQSPSNECKRLDLRCLRILQLHFTILSHDPKGHSLFCNVHLFAGPEIGLVSKTLGMWNVALFREFSNILVPKSHFPQAHGTGKSKLKVPFIQTCNYLQRLHGINHFVTNANHPVTLSIVHCKHRHLQRFARMKQRRCCHWNSEVARNSKFQR